MVDESKFGLTKNLDPVSPVRSLRIGLLRLAAEGEVVSGLVWIEVGGGL